MKDYYTVLHDNQIKKWIIFNLCYGGLAEDIVG